MVLVTINELIPLFNVITQTERLWHSQMTRNPDQTLATIRDMQPKLFQLSRRLRREAPSHKKIYINKVSCQGVLQQKGLVCSSPWWVPLRLRPLSLSCSLKASKY